MKQVIRKTVYAVALAAGINFGLIGTAAAHCDSLDGPVITEAKQALANGDVTPLLKWVPAKDEAKIRDAFDKASQVRKHGGDAQEIADHHLFATLVKVHRASEGAPFTGIKPAGGIDPSVMAADKALVEGGIDVLIAKINAKFEQNVRARYNAVVEARAHADESVANGREFVNRYVQYVHYIEGAHTAISADPGHAHASAATEHNH